MSMTSPKRFARDRRGVAAVEFALIAPILILIYFSLAELCMSLIAERKAGHVASAVGDLVAQNSQVTKGTLDGIFDIAQTVIKPFPTSSTTLQQCVFSVTKNAAGKATVDWSRSKVSGAPAGFCPTKGATITEGAASNQIPANLIGNSESIIGSKTIYKYQGAFHFLELSGQVFNFNPAFYLRPRKSDQVICSDC